MKMIWVGGLTVLEGARAASVAPPGSGQPCVRKTQLGTTYAILHPSRQTTSVVMRCNCSQPGLFEDGHATYLGRTLDSSRRALVAEAFNKISCRE